tara:strand:+ start:675 stop:998 length:324 start_codon:yes stop_codon:yes gene_type:complete
LIVNNLIKVEIITNPANIEENKITKFIFEKPKKLEKKFKKILLLILLEFVNANKNGITALIESNSVTEFIIIRIDTNKNLIFKFLLKNFISRRLLLIGFALILFINI